MSVFVDIAPDEPQVDSSASAAPANKWRGRLTRAALPLLSLIVFFIVWQIAAASGIWNQTFVPYPSAVWRAFLDISTTHDGTANPLGDYLASLASVSTPEPSEVLPAHEWRFRGLADRVSQLTRHHEGRLDELLPAIRSHPGSSAWDLAAHLTWSRPWDQYERRMRIFAVTETDAHLRLLAARGLIAHTLGPVRRWTLTAR